ncbi:MAG: UDP-N-acetylmuramoyl-L-alanine--D-glutamate ligase [Oscillospiraceae bacterium]|nr:UDP-N-acetylmuramoyl-L-alanine--D-glutamate ligase [Oscillospiraceae bacterium]
MSLKEYLASLRGKSVAVIGAGISNRPLIPLLAEAGAEVTVYDQASREQLGDFYDTWADRGVRFSLGPDNLDTLQGDIIFRTPGVLPTNPAIQRAVAAGSELTSEMELFMTLCPCRIIAVTGSAGKTTTTSILAALFQAAGYKVWLGGNIGRPLLAEVDSIAPEDIAVLELSSFQLHSMVCSPDVAVITNLTPNHLDKHGSLDDYLNAKKQIFRNQSPDARLILNQDDPLSGPCAKEAKCSIRWFSYWERPETGVFFRRDGTIYHTRIWRKTPIVAANKILIPGDHNIYNMMAAFAAAWELVPPDVMAHVAETFPGVPHRLETVAVRNGVTFINDSIATSPDRTIAGLKCFKEKVILIAGGKDKGLPFDELGPVLCQGVKSLYLTGMAAEKLRAAVGDMPGYLPAGPAIHMIDDFDQAVRAAIAEAQPGDRVVLSPACTSFDRFKNFEERGDAFRRIVMETE